MSKYKTKYTDKSRLPSLVSAYNLITESLKGLAIVKNCEVVMNRFYYDNEFFSFNFSVLLNGKECKYLIACPTNEFGNWTIRSNKWNGQREVIDTTSLSFGHFIRNDDHKGKK